jgi:hypothetical protein
MNTDPDRLVEHRGGYRAQHLGRYRVAGRTKSACGGGRCCQVCRCLLMLWGEIEYAKAGEHHIAYREVVGDDAATTRS